MDDRILLLDVVALADDLPDQGLLRGQVGTVVEILGGGRCEVEFRDRRGRVYGRAAVRAERLILLHYRPQSEAVEVEGTALAEG